MTDWTERWVPDAFIFALLATLIVVVAGVAFTPSTLPQVIDAWGKGFWELIPFTLQMALIIITGLRARELAADRSSDPRDCGLAHERRAMPSRSSRSLR